MRYGIYAAWLEMVKEMTLGAASCYERELLEGRNKKLVIGL